ncbi:MAG: L-seryl-tRNA(Sec) selenium transferase, partial [Ktedonobacteraceae bacterium]
MMTAVQEQLRLLPSIDELLQSTTGKRLINQYSRTITLHAIRATLAQVRADILHGEVCPAPEALLASAEHLLEQEQRSHLSSVINATGVIINTNLGRAPLSQQALQAVQRVAGG